MSNNQINNDSCDTLKHAIIFAWIFFLFILSWISVAVVGRAIDNFTFSTLKLDDKSTYHTCIIAFVIVAIELVTIYYFYSLGIPIYDPYIPNNNINETQITGSGLDKIGIIENLIFI